MRHRTSCKQIFCPTSGVGQKGIIVFLQVMHIKLNGKKCRTTRKQNDLPYVLLDFSLTVKAATLIFISRCGSAVSSAKERNSGFNYNLVKS